MVGWHHRLDGHEFERALGDSKGQESLWAAAQAQRVRLDLATEHQQGHGRGRSMSSNLFQNPSVSHLHLYRNAF